MTHPLAADQIRFSDGARYDAMMGEWSRSVGDIFLDWLKPAAGLHWIDVGCGSGAFTSLVAERCAPSSILGIDPSEGQLEFALARGLGDNIRFERGDAMALPLMEESADIAVAALVVHFMPDPAAGVAEMARVVRPGGFVAGYGWDLAAGGFPYEAVHRQLRALGTPPPPPPHPDAAGAAELLRTWTAAGLDGIRQREIVVTRTFTSFEQYWDMAVASPRIAAALGALHPNSLKRLKTSVRASLPQAPGGTIVPAARANAILGRVTRGRR